MRIAYMLSAFPVISETFVLNQITGLMDAGHEVDIFVQKDGDSGVLHQDVVDYDLLNRIYTAGDSYALMPRNRARRALNAVSIFFRANREQKRILLRCLNVLRLKGDAWSFSLFYRAWQAMQKPMDYDVVHCHFGNNGSRAAGLAAVGLLQAPIVTTFHGHDVTQDVRVNGLDLYQILFSEGDLMLPVSQRWEQELLKLGCAREKLKVHRMGINVDQFQIKEHRQESPCTILTVARLVEKKGLTYALTAMQTVVEVVPEVRYLIAGDGPLQDDLQQQIQKLGLSTNVHLLGRKSQSEIMELMNQSDIFLLPSVTAASGDMEGVPVVLMEAMASGIPVVSTVHSGIPELVEHDKSGYLVPERDTALLAQCIISLVSDASLRNRMGQEGRNKVTREFNIDRLNADLVDTFSSLITPTS